MTRPDAVLIVGAGLLQCHAIRTARALGLAPLVTDRDGAAPGVALADRWYAVDTYAVEAHRALVPVIQQDYTLRGVVCPGSDVAPSVAAAAAAAGVPGIPEDVARRTHHKGDVRTALMAADLQHVQPHWCLTPVQVRRSVLQSLPAAITFLCADHATHPLVVKPPQQCASRGVRIVRTWDAVATALEHAAQYGDEVLIEEYLTGTEHSAELLLDGDGKPLWFNVVDRVFSYEDGVPLERGHINPSRLALLQQDTIRRMLLRCAKALDVHWGPFKADVMWTADGPKILECTARLSGGFDSQGTSPLTGRDPTRALLQFACGLPVDAPLGPAQRYAACAAILPDKTGRLVALAPAWRGEEEVIWTVAPGAVLGPLAHNAQRPGFVLAAAPTYATAWSRAHAAADALAAAVEVG